MTYLSLGEAAKAAGVAKGTVSKALKSGKLSYSEKTSAGYKIDTSELFRVFPRKPLETPQNERLETPAETTELAVLRVRLDAAEQRASDLSKQLDRAHEEKLRLMALLPAPNEKGRQGFWSRLRGRV
ncbi:MAG: hypothetical protein JHD10_07855 [Sphingomonadaceae bacterium]|nr:hypothetical protein [Sphingomonadaceae bacterium]